MHRSSGTPMDEIYHLLGDPTRRYLLYQLQRTGQGNVEALATHIATVERGGDVDPDDASQRVYLELVHNHLPRLADHGVLEYDLRSGDVVLADGFSELEPLLEQFKRTEEGVASKLTPRTVEH